MTNFWALVGLATLAGVFVTLQSQFMGTMTKQIGAYESVFFTYAGGGVVITLLMVLLRGGNLGAWRTLPWYVYTSGILGLLIVGSIGYTAARLGLVMTFTIIVGSQFLLAALLDHFGLLGAMMRPLDWTRVLGVVVLLVGVWLIMR